MTECENINVIFADKSSKLFNIESRQTVDFFRKMVANSRWLENEKFFGFYFKDDLKNKYWLSDNKYIHHYDVMKFNCQTGLYFALKYFHQFDYWLSDQITKRLFYHQLKQQLYDGDIECDSDLCFQLLAMTLHLDDAKISFEDIEKMNIIPAHLFSKHPSINFCIQQIINKFELYESISKEELEKRFVVKILEIPYQMTHYFLAKNFNNSSITIGINKSGIYECENWNKSLIKLNYTWSEISNISYRKSRVNINIQDLTHRSSIRRKSSALSVSYDLPNPNLAKSFVYLAKDTINFINQSFEPVRIMSSNTRRNPNNIKKFQNNTYSAKQEKYRPSTQNAFISENEIMMSRSSSRLSLTSSNYAGSGITNDSGSLIMDDELLNTPVNVPEKQKLFLSLNERRKNIVNILNEKVKEAVQNCILEKNITRLMPKDYAKLDPKSQIKLTKFSIRTHFANEEISSYQRKKNSLMEEIETLQNIIGKLKENEKKHRAEIKQKTNQINIFTKSLQILEEEHALEVYQNSTRSNSEGCLFPYPNGDLSTINSRNQKSYESIAPLTEPRSRKISSIYVDPSSGSETLKSLNHRYSRMKSLDEGVNSAATSQQPTSPRRPSDVKNCSPFSNSNSQFQRFTSTRSQIKGLPNKLFLNFIQPNKSCNSNSSVESNYSFETLNTDAGCLRSSNSNTDSENSEDQVIRRYNSNNAVNHSVRDSREINMSRAKLTYKVSNMKLMSRSRQFGNNNPIPISASLEDVREDNSISSETQRHCAMRYRKDYNDSLNSISKLTYRPSKKDIKPAHLTRGKQPSIIRKAARPNLIQEKL